MRHVPAIWGTLDPFVELGPVIGRKVANAGFLEALLRADPFDQYHFFPPDGQSAEELQACLRQSFPGLGQKIRLFPRAALPALLRDTVYRAFHLSDCLTSQGWLTALRNRLAGNVFPITGVTHSLSYARYGQAFAQHVWAGVTARDCIVATSRAGQEAVRRILDACREHCGGGAVPEVARIPLGVWCSDFTESPDQDMCEALGVGPSRTVFLVPGRISPYSKMDLLPLLRAFQRLQKDGTDLRDLCVVLAGGADESETLPDILVNLAANIGLELLAVRHPDERTKKILLARSDAVISLADNPQETFGLTLLEAAAAGKPVIASDYDGYRDLVVHGETGLLVPTLDRGAEDVSLMAPLLYDSAYHMWLAQDVAVSVEELANHLRRMLSPDLRERLGRAAREYASRFDWSRIIGQYVDLWERLAAAPAPEPGRGVYRHPLALDYARVFESYSSARLGGACLLECTELGRAVYRGRDYPVVYAGLEGRVDLELMRRILVWTRQPLSWLGLREKAGADERLGPTVMWMLKGDLLRVNAGLSGREISFHNQSEE
ncbi:glycosyltransferase family 4 protein [Desulfomicrobium orale]|uniref:Glycosyl transferase family 1 domain-containing protein n=1 Tax=Desulfomicrobium orale DSM 12838 TaxID=888061 RepID=A0A109W669_9BACT|nr:glycosyltransferase family 4 protein [Desulfomicrobium orale]AMD93214.1 hypothetical protein AXF15_08940 [Desulfomicrobium orale DSM 12838]